MSVPIADIAQALLSGSSSSQAMALASELRDVSLVIERTPHVRRILGSPRVDASHVTKLLAGASVSQDVQEVISWLRKRRQVGLLPKLARVLEQAVAQTGDMMRIKVTSAIPLKKKEQEQLISQLSKRVDREVALDPVVDDRIIGGLIVDFPGEQLDLSVRGRLRRLRQAAVHTDSK